MSNHYTVTVRGASANLPIFFVSYGGYFPCILAGNTVTYTDKPDILFTRHYGHSITSNKVNAHGDRDCFQTHMEGELNITPLLAKELTFQDNYRPGELPCRTWYRKGSFQGYEYLVGTGASKNEDGHNVHWVVEENSATYHLAKRYYDDKLYSTIEYKVLSIVNDPRGNGYAKTYVYQRKATYSEKIREIIPNLPPDQNFTSTTRVGCYYWGVTSDLSSNVSIDKIDRALLACFDDRVMEHHVPDDFVDRVFDTLLIPDVNNVENLRDLKEIKKNLPPIIDVLKKRSFKSLSELYLWYKYSYSTTVQDLKSYYEFFQKWTRESKNSSGTKRTNLGFHYNHEAWACYTHYSIFSQNYNCGVLNALGIDLNLGNTWDLLPFSFVVDWFINLGDILQRLDRIDELSKMQVHRVITTTKYKKSMMPLAAMGCTSICSVVKFKRDIDNSLPVRALEVHSKNPGRHIVDGLALIIAKR